MELLQSILDNTQYSFISALILGLMTAISPCPLATNISAIGFIGRDLENKRGVFISGLIYTLGRAFSYTMLALIIFLGASKLNVSRLFQGYGEKLLGPLLIVVGIFMLNLIRIPLPSVSGLADKLENKGKKNYLTSFLLGAIFALAFCPYSGVLYFMMLIPMTVSSASGLYLPIVFAIATGLPVILFAWLLAYAVGNVGKLYNNLRSFEFWFRRIVAVIFIACGIYFLTIYFIN
ncbi:MAG: aromatic aminobenezylarsenical efflux permease ArsG family transporter [Sphingobacteriia bacterium]|nr:aromatic aminobenezylarsenical efflux permease ArsG family transporter [Sphingobacteriia bacterium]